MKSGTVRWLPALLAPVLVAGAIAAPAIASALPPSLPERSPAAVLALTANGERVRGYTAEIEQQVDLGLPDLSGLTGGSASAYGPPESAKATASPSTATSSSASATEALTLLTSDQRARVQVAPNGLKVQLTTGDGEKSLTVNSKEAWTWDWDAQEATHYTFPKRPELSADQQRKLGDLRAKASSRLAQLNPQEIAKSLLDKTSGSTRVSLGSNVRVAGQNAYELVFTPKQNASLVRDVRVAIDARTGMVLRVQAWAKAGDKLAYSLGYTSLNYAIPSASAFNFTAPSGAKVIEKPLSLPVKPQRSDVQKQLEQLQAKAKAADTPREREQLKKELTAQVKQLLAKAEVGNEASAVSDLPDLGGVSVTGSGWASVIHLPAKTIDAASLKQFKSLLEPLDGGAYGLSSTLLSIRIDADGSLSAGSVPLSSLR